MFRIIYILAVCLSVLFAQSAYGQDDSLEIGIENVDRFGFNYSGVTSQRERLDLTFIASDSPLVLSLTGYDIDLPDEVSILVNNTNIGFLNTSANNGSNTTEIAIPSGNLVSGENLLSFVQKTPGWKWGVTHIQLSAQQRGNNFLYIGVSNPNIFGYYYLGVTENREYLDIIFDTSVDQLVLSLSAYDIDIYDEVSLSLNGTLIGYLSTTPNNRHSQTVLNLPKNLVRVGNNTLRFSQKNSGWRWGVSDLLLSINTVQPTKPDLNTYDRVFNEDFSGTTLNPDKWHTSLLWGPYWAINREEQIYVDTQHMHSELEGTASDPFELTGSTLKINATPTSASLPPPPRPPRTDPLYKRKASTYRYGDAVGTPGEPGYRPPYDPDKVNYLSGIITSYESFKMTHGYVEARAKLPAGQGLWPAFWMLPTHYVEAVPEIDVMEFLGQDVDRIYNTYHFFDVPAGWQLRSTPSFPVYATDWTQDFHTFGMAWSPKKIVWYVDGVETHSITDETVHAASGAKFKIASQAMYLIANLAVGGSWPGAPDDTTEFPATYEIDYIRAYKKKTADPINLSRDYQLMFGDEFNGSSLDPLKWESHFIWGPYLPINNEEQYYVDALYTDADLGYTPFVFDQETIDSENVKYLSITARTAMDPAGIEPPDALPDDNDPIWTEHKTFNQNDSYEPQSYTSGLLTSYQSFRFAKGYAEVRARVPKGDGLWPAFWLLNRYYISQQPEIDILEVRGRRPDQAIHNYHRYPIGGGPIESDEYTTTYGTRDEGYSDGFHTFGARWRPGRIDWYVDGVREHSYIGDDVGYQLMYVLVNLAVGGGFDPGAPPNPEEFPKTFDIDYIRVYQEKDTP